MTKMILLITNKEDVTVDFVVRELRHANCEFYRLNTEDIPEFVEIRFSIDKGNYIIYDKVKSQSIDLNRVSAVYFRRPKISELTYITGVTLQEKQYLQRELATLLEGIYKTLRKAFWINDIYKIREAENKIYQLQLAQQIGFEIPSSAISNNAYLLKDMIESTEDNCIIKPVRSGNMGFHDGREVIFTARFKGTQINAQERVAAFPIYLQENLDKEYDIRCIVVGEEVFAAAIDSQGNPDAVIDWRKSKIPLPHEKIQLPTDIQEKAIAITQALGLTYSAIDMVLDRNKSFVFLECNPNGQWAWIETRLGYPISATIVDLLQNGE